MANATLSLSTVTADEELKAHMAEVAAKEPDLWDADPDDLKRWYFELDSIGAWLSAEHRSTWKRPKETCPSCGSTRLDRGEAQGESKIKPYVACLDCNALLSWG